MKKIIIATLCLFVATLFNSCGVGNYTVTSGVEDKASVCFSASSAYDINVTIDDQHYTTTTVKDIAHKTRRNIKETAKSAILPSFSPQVFAVVEAFPASFPEAGRTPVVSR